MSKELTSEPFVWPIRVYIEDTDAGGVVYYARYLHFFERARTELLRARGLTQRKIRQEHGLIWVVLDIRARFRRAARLDDELLVSAELSWMKGVRQGFAQEITRRHDGERIASAELSVALLHAENYRPARVPAWIRAELTNNAK